MKYLTHLSPDAYGWTSHILSVQSIAFVRTCVPSGLVAIPVIVSVCPGSVRYGASSFRTSYALSTLSTPPV